MHRRTGFVVNFTFPLTVEDYVHRVGRTGRAGATGEAHTFFTTAEKGLAGGLGNVLREAGMEVRMRRDLFSVLNSTFFGLCVLIVYFRKYVLILCVLIVRVVLY